VPAQDVAVCTAAGEQKISSVASAGTEFLAVWTDYRGGMYPDVRCRVLEYDGSFIGDELVVMPGSSSNVIDDGPRACFAEYDYLVVWRDATLRRICGRRVNEDGVILHDTFTVTSGTQPGRPAIAYSGTDYLVTYDYNMQDLYARTVSVEGVPGSEFPISTMTGGQSTSQVAWGGVYLVVWRDARRGSSEQDIYGQLVSADGQLLGSEIPIVAGGPDLHMFPRVATNGLRFLVTWHDNRDGRRDIYGQFVSPSGSLIGGEFLIDTTSDVSHWLSRNGSNFTVVWSSGGDLWGRAVSADGHVAAPVHLTSLPNSEYSPILSDDVLGVSRFLAWRDTRNGNSDVYARHNPVIGVEEQRGGSFIPDRPVLPTPIRGRRLRLDCSWFDADAVHLRIHDALGRELFSRSFTVNHQRAVTIDLPELRSGVYVLQTEAEGRRRVQRLSVLR
jgi:hypothetical protein